MKNAFNRYLFYFVFSIFISAFIATVFYLAGSFIVWNWSVEDWGLYRGITAFLFFGVWATLSGGDPCK